MRRSKAEIAQEVFARSEQRIEERKKRYAYGGMSIVAMSLVVLLGFAIFDNKPIAFGDKVMNVIALDLAEGRSYYAAEMEQVEELLERLDSYTEVALLDDGQYDKADASHYFLFEDINGAEKNYYLYEDGTLVCSDGKTYHLDEEQLQSLIGNVEENFFWNQQASIGQYERLMNNYYENQSYANNFGGAYIDKNGELVVLLVDINEESIRQIQEAIHCTSMIIKECEYSYAEMMRVIDAINAKLRWPVYAELGISVMHEDVYTNRVYIEVRKLTDEKEARIREIIDSPCMVISDSASKVTVSPLAEEDINQIPGASMSIVEGSVTPTSLTAIFSYMGAGEIMYGPDNYYIEGYKEEDGNWYRLSSYRSLISDVGRIFSADRTVEETYDWEWAYDVLPAGRYRIMTECHYENAEGDRESTYLAVEFYIE